ncbi:hypothetical protein [Halostella sp. PRR32]|uniref:hypothetical protein n=1 Tax=Halostella sp. PRR32 TaxID=3098147 RepID=UPI002B1D8C85|nr:hypothetical protein [Halostella sp. PRR32]
MTEIGILRFAFGLLGIAAFIYTPLSIQFNHLLPRAKAVLSDKRAKKQARASYLAVLGSFLCVILFMILFFALTAFEPLPKFSPTLDIQGRHAVGFGSLLLLCAVGFPTTAAAVTSWSLFSEL